jgi:hypothetical protein
MKLRLLFLTLCIYVHAYSQYKYRPGYIVKLDGKTEEGLINSRSIEFNAKKCEFKKDINTDPLVYLPNSIRAYRFLDSKYFVSKRVLIENADTVLFLECLISGKVSIYYTQWNSHDHYYLEKDGKLVEIQDNLINVVQDGFDYQRPSNQYKGVLKYYLRDCPQISKELDNADFSKKTLIKLSKEYHEYVCKDEQCIIYEKPIHKKRLRFGIDFSYGTSALEYDFVNLNIAMKSNMHFQFGINSQMSLDDEGAFNLQVALRYYSFKNELLNDMDYEIGTFPSDLHYQYSILKPEIQLQYKMKFWKIVPFASAGFFTNYFLSDEGYIFNKRFDKTIRFTSDGIDREEGSKNGMLGVVGEIGVETGLKPGNLSLSFFYENFLTTPFRTSHNLGIRCGFSVSFN